MVGEHVARIGIGPAHDVVQVLEREGVEKFVQAWEELLDSMKGKLA